MKKRHIYAITAALIIAFSGTNYLALAEQYPLSITAEAKNEVAEIRISGVIHQWQNSAEAFRARIDDLLAQGIENVNIYINCPGGSVFEANEIANEIERFPGTIKGFGGALVASAASYLALICDTFEMAENGQYMYHKPHGVIQGNEDTIESQLKLLKSLTSQYRAKYAEKTGMTEAQIEANWAKGDVWLSASEALKQKFITGISKKKAQITQEQKAMFVACGAPTTPRINTKPDIKMNLKIIAQNLGLPEDSTEEQINAKILANKKAADDAEQARQLAETNAKEANKIKAKKLLDDAVIAKKMDAKQAAALTSWAEANYEACEEYVNGLQPITAISKHVTPGKTADIAAKKFEEMTDEEQKQLMDEDPAAFAKAYDAYLTTGK